jgi:hypothetical protein
MAREAAVARAELRPETYLTAEGETICLASPPLVVEQAAADHAGGNASLCAEIAARLRHRAELYTS